MATRPRIDLDGVTLRDPGSAGTAIAIFGRRTTDGLRLLIPESATFVVPWTAIREASLDLATGCLRLGFENAYVKANNWLRGAHTLEGQWLDRHVVTE